MHQGKWFLNDLALGKEMGLREKLFGQDCEGSRVARKKDYADAFAYLANFETLKLNTKRHTKKSHLRTNPLNVSLYFGNAFILQGNNRSHAYHLFRYVSGLSKKEEKKKNGAQVGF